MKRMLLTALVIFTLAFPLQSWGCHDQNQNQGQKQKQKQKQLQGQIQGQQQKTISGSSSSSSSSSTSSANNKVDISTAVDNQIDASSKLDNQVVASPTMGTEVVVEEIREFASPGNVPSAEMPSYYGRTPVSHEFQAMKTLLRMKNYFSATEIKTMNTQKGGTNLIVTPLVSKVKKSNRASGISVFTVMTDRTLHNMKGCGYVTAVSKKKNVVSVALLVDVMGKALAYGADTLLITFDDDNSKLSTSGWGIGGSYTHAAISSTQSNSGIGTGGSGFNRGSAGYEGRPWFQAFMLKAGK